MQVKVENMVSPSSGREVSNQFVRRVGSKTIFQSYSSVIAIKESGKPIKLDKNRWNYSSTTSKYRNQFLGETTAETKRKIEDGTYKLTNLNR